MQHLLKLWCYKRACFDIAGNAWMGALVRRGAVVCYRPTKVWYVSLGMLPPMVVLWRLPPGAVSKNGPVRLQVAWNADPRLEYIPCLELDDWERLPSSCVSPSHVSVLTKSRKHAPYEIVLQPTEPALGIVSLLRGAALECFWTIPITFLRRLARSEGLVVKHLGADLLALKSLLEHCPPHASK